MWADEVEEVTCHSWSLERPDRALLTRGPDKGMLKTADGGHIHQPPCPMITRLSRWRDGSKPPWPGQCVFGRKRIPDGGGHAFAEGGRFHGSATFSALKQGVAEVLSLE
ncbi:hypothetical protein GCM10010503_32480 [Streptomyces lucensis JCM 4490]|uniref:Uncharacterized protein n=1 Tax=Streptomyces lucensis JCM 4490 TaxID=1306176 RepID=A0A918MRZ7_9ACTN|nr:hypothetical protein GCM10010503_32480 [Streptomyces lucensis JCM 4490]